MKIDWDPAKAKANLFDHGIGFSEAATVLMDDQALTREDPMLSANSDSSHWG